MSDPEAPRAQHPALIEEQLRLLEERRADVADLLVEPGGACVEAVLDRLANDLVGARLVLRAVLAAPPAHGLSGAEREDLESREREASELLGAVLAHLPPRRRAGS